MRKVYVLIVLMQLCMHCCLYAQHNETLTRKNTPPASKTTVKKESLFHGTATKDSTGVSSSSIKKVNANISSVLDGGDGGGGGGNTCDIAGKIAITASSGFGCTGDNSTTITVTGNNGTIQWESSIDGTNFTPIPGEISQSYTAVNLISTTYYRATVSNSALLCSAKTDAVTVNISLPNVTINPTGTGCDQFDLSSAIVASEPNLYFQYLDPLQGNASINPVVSSSGYYFVLGYRDPSFQGCYTGQQVFVTITNNSTTWYKDADNDGYSDGTTLTQCTRPAGYRLASELKSTSGDCDDNDPTVWQSTFFVQDNDGDGYATGDWQMICYGDAPPKGWIGVFASQGEDCDDNDASKYLSITYFKDFDGDGYDDGLATICGSSFDALFPPHGYKSTTLGHDCNDNDNTINSATTWYKDADNDGYSSGDSITNCTRPAGYKLASELYTTSGDCNDDDPTVRNFGTFKVDKEGDHFIAGIESICYGDYPPPGYLSLDAFTFGYDCDDNNPAVWVSALMYIDNDGDGYDNGQATVCVGSIIPTGYSATTNGHDCDDNNASINPLTIWYKDADNDGYSDGVTLQQCTRPAAYKLSSELNAASGDCNDNNAAVHPNAVEICDGIDNNCDGQTDEGCTTNPITIKISDAAKKEGDKGQRSICFTVSLNKKSNQVVKVNYTTQNGTATAGSDYAASSGTLIFAAGIKTQTIYVNIYGDKNIEPDETFSVLLSNPVNASIADNLGVGTIVNDDAASVALQSIASTHFGNNKSIKISPNPATSVLNLQLTGYTGNITIQISDLVGKILQKQKLLAGTGKYLQQKIDVSNLLNGVYLLTVIDDTGLPYTEKIIVAR